MSVVDELNGLKISRFTTARSDPAGRSNTRDFIGKTSKRSGAPGGTRTPDLLVRSQTLYPTELRARR
jgi:hypothetical protein